MLRGIYSGWWWADAAVASVGAECPECKASAFFFLFNFFSPSTIEQRKQAVWTHVYLSFLRSIFFSFLFFYIKIVADYFQGTDKSQCFHCTL